MTPKQTSLYWREWAAARRALIAAGYDAAEADAERDHITARVLGKRVSSKRLSNVQLDQILAAYRDVSRGGDLAAQIRADQQPRDRILWSLRNNQLPRIAEQLPADTQVDERYLQRIARQALQLDHDPDLTTLDHPALLIVLRAVRIHCTRLVRRGQEPHLHSRPIGDIDPTPAAAPQHPRTAAAAALQDA
jgi:hypothetical protein